MFYDILLRPFQEYSFMEDKYEKYDEWLKSMEEVGNKMNKIAEKADEGESEVNLTLDADEAQMLFSGLANSDVQTWEERNLGRTSGFFALKDLASDLEETYDEISEWLNDRGLNPGEDHYEFLMQHATIKFLSDKYVLFFSLLSALIEEKSVELLKEELIEEEFRESDRTKTLLKRRMNQEQREQFLLRTGVIDNGLASELSRVRTLRNMVLHDLENRMFLDENIGSNDVERGLTALEELTDDELRI